MQQLKNIFIIIILTVLCVPQLTVAQTENNDQTTTMFEARVTEVLAEQKLEREDGSINLQQNLKLIGLDGEWKNKEITFTGISELDVISSNVYKVGDKVMVAHSRNIDGGDVFYITDYARATALYWLGLIFIILVIIIGRTKGFRSLLSLLASFIIIIYFMLPAILNGANPIFVGVIGSLFILVFLIYITEGFNVKSHLAIVSILFSLIIVSIIAVIFKYITHLSGLAQEEILFLVDAGEGKIDFSGLLLTGILIGTLGVIDDVVISQIESVAQLKIANPSLSKKQLFVMAFEIGQTHMGAMINTLFLAYAGAALPLLLLFTLRQEPFFTFNQIISNEMMAVEIVRTIVGSIGIILSIPIATILAVYMMNVQIKNDVK